MPKRIPECKTQLLHVGDVVDWCIKDSPYPEHGTPWNGAVVIGHVAKYPQIACLADPTVTGMTTSEYHCTKTGENVLLARTLRANYENRYPGFLAPIPETQDPNPED